MQANRTDDREIADRIYAELAAVIERRLPELPEDNDDRRALEDCLAGLGCRVPMTGAAA